MTDCGDFVDSDNEEEVDDLEENAEPLILYFQQPFYYPIYIGNVLAQRYRIEHKLGHGGFSTVWMAHDIVTKKDVALKVSTLPRDAADPESTMHNEIRQRVQDTSKLLLSCGTFTLPSPNGHHRVLVFPLRGPNLHSCFASMSMADRMSAAKQVLQALKCLHDANIVHRDLNDKNIMCGIVPLDAYDIKMKYQYLGRPRKIPLQTKAGMKGELVRPRPQSPSAWCAPERFHNINPSAASDMWSYMCVFTELYLGTLPWSIYGDALPGMVKVLGPLPWLWHNYYHQPTRKEASWYDPKKQREFTLEAMIARTRPDVSSTERAHVLSFMLRGFSYEPQHRITAAQLFNNASFQAVMGVYGA
ncbi:kinase-like protein [Stipitochalara longipes BDJ]|nr:kinase-like protein [Stipitochalara longipes BDJ]